MIFHDLIQNIIITLTD